MNKTGNVKLLNSTESASSTVLLSRQIRASGATAGAGTGGSGYNPPYQTLVVIQMLRFTIHTKMKMI